MGFMHFNTWNLSHLKNQILVKKKEQPRKKIVTGTKEQFAFIENKCKIHTPNEQKWINAYLECFNSVSKADVSLLQHSAAVLSSLSQLGLSA